MSEYRQNATKYKALFWFFSGVDKYGRGDILASADDGFNNVLVYQNITPADAKKILEHHANDVQGFLRNPSLAQGQGYVPMLNPIRTRHKGIIKRAGVTRKAYKARPSQSTGRAPGGRLLARRANAPVPGYFPNPRRAKPREYVLSVDDPDYRSVDAVTPVPWVIKLRNARSKFIYTLPPDIWGSPAFIAWMNGATKKTEWITLVDLKKLLLSFRGETMDSPHYPIQQSQPRRMNPRKARATVTPLIHSHHVLIPLQGGRVGVGAGFKTQDAAMKRAQDMAEASGVPHRVASRAWIKSHLKAA